MSAEQPRHDYQGCGQDAAPYVLGALPETEHEAFVAHLQSCAICREEVAALQVVAASLPAAVPQLSAPGDLKRRVMATVQTEAELRGASASRAAPRGRAPRLSVSWRPALGALAALAAIAVLVVVGLTSTGGGGTRVIHAQVTAPAARATVRVSSGHAELDIAGMPQSPPGHVYEVWVKRSGGPQPTDALFTVSSTGTATVGVPGAVSGVTAIMVTAEPKGGSRVPTSAPVIVARLG